MTTALHVATIAFVITSRRLATLATWAALWVSAGCGATSTPSGPTATMPLPLVRETATMRVYYEPGDTVDVEWQESYNAWALAQLGVQPPQPIEYRKYQSRGAMGSYTGHSTTNGFAEPEQWRFHTIWPRDNHEIIHVFSALVGRPCVRAYCPSRWSTT